jgi:hypothetical protein
METKEKEELKQYCNGIPLKKANHQSFIATFLTQQRVYRINTTKTEYPGTRQQNYNEGFWQ